MPVIITKDSTDFYLVPSPLVSFSRQTYNNVGRAGFGADFSLSLEGTLVPEKGNPYYNTSNGEADLSTDNWTKTGDGANSEPNFGNDPDQLLAATIRKQEKIRTLFSNPVISGVSKPIYVNITNWGETTSGLKFAAFVDDISFDSSSRGVNPQSYTINLRCDSFLSSADDNFENNNDELEATYAITNITENFDIAEDDRVNVKFAGAGVDVALDSVNKIYTVSRSTSVVGAPRYDSDGNYVSGAPWQQASGYMYNVLGLGSGIVPTGRHSFLSNFGPSGYKIANRVISENIDKEEGTYAITESFTAYSGDPVIHTISVDVSTAENQTRTVSVQGTIEGLNTEDPFAVTKNNFVNASGFNAKINPTDLSEIPSGYFYGKSLSQLSWLNPIPRSRSLGRDIQGGSMSYSYSFDDRPPNLVSGSVSESINISDTYPGELFSATPVIGRNQPILQYLNSRSEFKRNLSINIIMGQTTNNWSYSDAPSGYWGAASQSDIQKWFLTDKPSNISIPSGNLNTIFQAANPVNDPNFTVRGGKCFHSAPNESWDAYSKTYSYSIEWTYEREM